MSASARELYLASLDPNVELSTRRMAERSGLPDNDPMWLLLHEVHRSISEASSSAKAALENEPFAARLSAAIGTAMIEDARIIDALTVAIRSTQEASLRSIRFLESTLRDFARKRAAVPFASIAFASALAIIASIAAIWNTYHVAVDYGKYLGYRAGFTAGMSYERSHR